MSDGLLTGSNWQQQLRTMPYEEYLQTGHWHVVREAALSIAQYQCQLCGDDRSVLDVHHHTYARRGEERLSDVVALCRRCHDAVHDGRTEVALDPDLMAAESADRQTLRRYLAHVPPFQWMDEENPEWVLLQLRIRNAAGASP